jgi:two-component system chemotaxis response regulator CheY
MLQEGQIKGSRKILLTGLADQQDTIRAINDAGIDLYVEKPWDGDELIKSVKDLLGKYVAIHGLDDAELKPYLE